MVRKIYFLRILPVKTSNSPINPEKLFFFEKRSFSRKYNKSINTKFFILNRYIASKFLKNVLSSVKNQGFCFKKANKTILNESSVEVVSPVPFANLK